MSHESGPRSPEKRNESLLEQRQLLEIDGISVEYGPVTALRNVSLVVREGEAVALIGANGAGKSTLVKTIIGFLSPSRGRITFADRALADMRPERRVRLGVGYTPEGRRVFPGLSV